MKKQIENNNNSFSCLWNWLIFSVYFLVGVFLVSGHVPWRDEAQSWLLARDLSWSKLIAQMPYEGTPPLWHFLVKILVEAGLPYFSQNIMNFLIITGAVFLLIFFSPLPKKIRFLLPFSYYFIFEYLVIARNYAMSTLFAFALAAVYYKRRTYPLLYSFLIISLAWSSVHAFVFAFLIATFFIWDIFKDGASKLREKFALIFSVLGLVLVPVLLIPYSDQAGQGIFTCWWRIIVSSSEALLPVPEGHYLSFFVNLSVIFWPLFYWQLLYSKRMRLTWVASWLWLEYIFLFKHLGGLRHFALILVFFISVWWIDYVNIPKENKERKSYFLSINLFSIFLLLSVIIGALFIVESQYRDFSGSREVATYIQENELMNEELVSYPDYIGTTILPYFPDKKIYQLGAGRRESFVTWDDSYYLGNLTPLSELFQKLLQYYKLEYPNLKSVLFITPLSPTVFPDLELLFENSRPTIKGDEHMFIYRLQLLE